MRGYGDLSYFMELDFIESLKCYVHLVQDFENELTVEKLIQIISAIFSTDGATKPVENIVDEYVEQFF